MFMDILIQEPNLLDFFDFLGKGMHENIKINNEENDKKHIFKIVRDVFKIEMNI